MKIDDSLSVNAVHARMGMEAVTDEEARLMRELLVKTYTGRDIDDIGEQPWLALMGEVQAMKSSGWMKDEDAPGHRDGLPVPPADEG